MHILVTNVCAFLMRWVMLRETVEKISGLLKEIVCVLICQATEIVMYVFIEIYFHILFICLHNYWLICSFRSKRNMKQA